MQSVPITTNVVSLNPAQARCTHTTLCDKLVSHLWQVSGFLQIFRLSLRFVIVCGIFEWNRINTDFYMTTFFSFFVILLCPSSIYSCTWLLWYLPSSTWSRFGFWFMVFKANFNNVQFYWWRKPEYLEKTTDLPQVTDKLKKCNFKQI
jgi:hypothetical protein